MGVVFTNGKPASASKYDQHLESNPIVGTTSKTKVKNLGGGLKEETLESSEQEVLSKGQIIPPHKLCRLEVGGGQTIQTVPYESVRLDVRLTVPCTHDDLESAYEFASDWVSNKIMEAVNAAKGI